MGHHGSIELKLAFTEVAEARFVYGPRADGRGVAYVYVLRARRVGARESPQGSSKALKFCKRIKRGVVIKVVVRRQPLVIREGMIDADLELVAPVSVVRNGDYRAGASACPRHVPLVHETDRHGIKAGNGHLVIHLCVEVCENTRREQGSSRRIVRTAEIIADSYR